jgi:DNA-binding transcriptional regulator of glucitol operon
MKKMKKLKGNQPEFRMNSGKFSGKSYVRGVSYDDSDIPDEHKNKFVTVKQATPAKVTSKEKKKEEKSK